MGAAAPRLLDMLCHWCSQLLNVPTCTDQVVGHCTVHVFHHSVPAVCARLVMFAL